MKLVQALSAGRFALAAIGNAAVETARAVSALEQQFQVLDRALERYILDYQCRYRWQRRMVALVAVTVLLVMALR